MDETQPTEEPTTEFTELTTYKEELELIEEMCKGRCNFVFQAVKTSAINDSEGNVIGEKIDEGCLFCSVCTALRSVYFT